MINGASGEVWENVRMSYSRINEVIDMPNLIEIQKTPIINFGGRAKGSL